MGLVLPISPASRTNFQNWTRDLWVWFLVDRFQPLSARQAM
ncbi:MAG TPA: hypothetical protein VFW20_11020 [Candidatus Limnocylindrales bacterium]|nr:hypothetical protein [Candidatus Limnocylindrales bacterium]